MSRPRPLLQPRAAPIPPRITALGRLPDLICIGAQKAATTWFQRVMAARPDTWAPPVKEVHFFNHRFVDRHGWTEPHMRERLARSTDSWRERGKPAEQIAWLEAMQQGEILTEAWYQRLFAPAPPERICVEATPEYSVLPENGVDYVADLLPHARFVYLIRDPVERALSQLRMNATRQATIPKDVSDWQALARDPEIDERGDYATYVPRWRQRFGPDRLLFIPYRDIARAPALVLRRIERFAGLQRNRPGNLRNRINATRPLRIPPVVVAEITERYADQRVFLRQEFGRLFAART